MPFLQATTSMPAPLNRYYDGYNRIGKLTDYSLEWKRENEGLYTDSLQVIKFIVENDNYKTDLTKPFHTLFFHCRVPRNVIKYLLDHGASATRGSGGVYWDVAVDEAARRHKWLLVKMMLLHGALVKQELTQTAPAAHRRWFNDFLTWRAKTKSFAYDIKRKADAWNFMPPSYVGDIVIERQGYIETRIHFEQMLWLCPKCYKPLGGERCKACERQVDSEMYCGYCSLPMEGGRCNKVCESESTADSRLWSCPKCDSDLSRQGGKCKNCEK